MREAPGNLHRNLPKIHHVPRAGGAFHHEIIAEVVMELLERFDNEIVDRKPARTTPVRIAAEESGCRFSRLIVNRILHSIDAETVRLVPVNARKSAA